MKKLIFSVVAGLVLCTAGFTGYKIYDNYQMSKYSPLMLKNLEALTQLESWKECNNNVNMTPNGVIKASETQSTTVDTDANGEFTLGSTVHTGFEANKAYEVKYQILNCERWEGSCCDQTRVGISIVSTKKK
jgi:hypothetical protein